MTTIILLPSLRDGELVEKENGIPVAENEARLSSIISEMLDDEDEDNEILIPLPGVEKKYMELVCKYMKYHANVSDDKKLQEFEKPLRSSQLDKIIPKWYANFINNIDLEDLFQLTLAANYLDIHLLLELSCARFATMIKGKTPDEVCETFGIENDFTEEEKNQLQKDNEWVEETANDSENDMVEN